MTNNTPNTDWLDEVLATIGVNGINDKRVVGRAGAKQAILQHEQQAKIELIRSLDTLGDPVLQEKHFDEVIATLTQQISQGVNHDR